MGDGTIVGGCMMAFPGYRGCVIYRGCSGRSRGYIYIHSRGCVYIRMLYFVLNIGGTIFFLVIFVLLVTPLVFPSPFLLLQPICGLLLICPCTIICGYNLFPIEVSTESKSFFR